MLFYNTALIFVKIYKNSTDNLLMITDVFIFCCNTRKWNICKQNGDIKNSIKIERVYTMNVKFRVKNFELTDNAKSIITSKLESLSGMLNEDILINVSIVKRTKDFKTELKVQNGKEFVRSEEVGRTLQKSIELAINTLKKRLRKIKAIRISKKRDSAVLFAKEINEIQEDYLEEKIERVKHLKVDIMDEDEAILALESLNHSFFIFKNADRNNEVCVLYRRDTGYGLIELEFAEK